MADSPADVSLWDFACAVYAAAGVSSAWLALQQAVAADVNLLLFAAWIGCSRGVALAPEQGRRAASWVAAWHDEIVRPLRAVGDPALVLYLDVIARAAADWLA